MTKEEAKNKALEDSYQKWPQLRPKMIGSWWINSSRMMTWDDSVTVLNFLFERYNHYIQQDG